MSSAKKWEQCRLPPWKLDENFSIALHSLVQSRFVSRHVEDHVSRLSLDAYWSAIRSPCNSIPQSDIPWRRRTRRTARDWPVPKRGRPQFPFPTSVVVQSMWIEFKKKELVFFVIAGDDAGQPVGHEPDDVPADHFEDGLQEAQNVRDAAGNGAHPAHADGQSRLICIPFGLICMSFAPPATGPPRRLSKTARWLRYRSGFTKKKSFLICISVSSCQVHPSFACRGIRTTTDTVDEIEISKKKNQRDHFDSPVNGISLRPSQKKRNRRSNMVSSPALAAILLHFSWKIRLSSWG